MNQSGLSLRRLRPVRRARIVLRLELLEDRTLLSVAGPVAETDNISFLEPLQWVDISDQQVSAALDQGDVLIGVPTLRADSRFTGVTGDGYNGSAPIGVAVIDTGIDVNQPSRLHVAGGTNTVTGGSYDDDNSHGSHVAGIIASNDPSYTGVAPGVNLFAVKVLSSSGSGSVSAIANGLQWVINNAAAYNIKVVNMSLGDGGNYAAGQGSFWFSTIHSKISTLQGMGVTVVSAAGNSYYSYQRAGSSDPGSVSTLDVGAVWSGNFGGVQWSSGSIDYSTGPDRLVSFSQRDPNNSHFVLAPGAIITSTVPIELDPDAVKDGFAAYAGTSMATPYVTGVVALMQDAAIQFGSRYLTPSEVVSILRSTAVTVYDGDNENDNVANTNANYLRVDANAALVAVYNLFGATPPPTTTDLAVTGLSAIPTSVIAGNTVNVSVTVQNVGNQNVTASIPVTLTNQTTGSILGNWTLSGLAAGAISSHTFTWNTNGASLGGHTLLVSQGLGDDNTSNDSKTTTVTVTAAITDLAVTTLSATPSAVVQGNTVNVNVTVQNVGNQNVIASIPVTLMDQTAGSILGTWALSGLAAGATSTQTFTWDTTAASFGSHTLQVTQGFADDSNSNDSQTIAVTINEPPPPSSTQLYLSVQSNGTVGVGSGAITVANEDIVAFDGNNFSLFFDGSDVGLGGSSGGFTIDAFTIIPASQSASGKTEILLSFAEAGWIGGTALPLIDDSDIVRFTANSLGENTSGTWDLYFDGSDVGLTSSWYTTTSPEGIDAVALLPNGHLLVSTKGSFSVPGVSGQGEDILEFTPTALGGYTAGKWSQYFDGSDVGLSGTAENVDAVAVDGSGKIYLSTAGNFSVPGLSGGREDVLVFTPATLGSNTAGTYSSPLFFDGSLYGLGSNNVSGIALPGADGNGAGIHPILPGETAPAQESAFNSAPRSSEANSLVLLTLPGSSFGFPVNLQPVPANLPSTPAPVPVTLAGQPDSTAATVLDVHCGAEQTEGLLDGEDRAATVTATPGSDPITEQGRPSTTVPNAQQTTPTPVEMSSSSTHWRGLAETCFAGVQTPGGAEANVSSILTEPAGFVLDALGKETFLALALANILATRCREPRSSQRRASLRGLVVEV